jgi:hypothetical protein
MAQLEFDLPSHLLAALYARIVRRELGIPLKPRIPVSTETRIEGSLFARSVTVALGQSYAIGDFIRNEFAQALLRRLPTYPDLSPIDQNPALGGVLSHAAALLEIIAARVPFFGPAGIEIADNAVAEAAASDYRRLLRLRSGAGALSAEELLGPLWPMEEPTWWRIGPDPPDRWVMPMTRLGMPVWSSERLPPDSLVYLVNFGLDRIESRPDLIEPWTGTVRLLVASASKRKVDIREAVSCCMVDP